MPVLEKPRGAKTKKKRGYRDKLPSERCVFCKRKSTRKLKCSICNFECTGTCKECLEYGALDIRAPRRMQTVISKGGKTRRICYPHCARKEAYYCRNCNMWHDSTLLHMVVRTHNNRIQSLCIKCNEKYGYTVCSSCHGVCSQESHRKDETGYRCESCFESRAKFTPSNKGGRKMKVVKKGIMPVRTFGIELEINQVHMADEVAKEVGALNIHGIEFDVKRDGSIHNGFEIASYPAELSLLNPAIKAMCKTIRKYKHNYENAGIHIHVSDPYAKIHHILRSYCSVEDFFFSFLPRFRWGNIYCHSILENGMGEDSWLKAQRIFKVKDEESARAMAGCRGAINLGALDKYGTIEYRAFNATSDHKEIMHFFTFLDYLYRMAIEKPDSSFLTEVYGHSHKCRTRGDNNSFQKVSELIKLPAYTAKFLLEKKQYFDKMGDKVNHKTHGVLRSYQYTNANTSEEVRRVRVCADGFVVPPSRNRRVNISSSPPRLLNRDSSQIIRVDLDNIVTHHRNRESVGQAIRNPSMIVTDIEEGISDIYYVVSNGTTVWAYTCEDGASDRSGLIRRTIDRQPGGRTMLANTVQRNNDEPATGWMNRLFGRRNRVQREADRDRILSYQNWINQHRGRSNSRRDAMIWHDNIYREPESVTRVFVNRISQDIEADCNTSPHQQCAD